MLNPNFTEFTQKIALWGGLGVLKRDWLETTTPEVTTAAEANTTIAPWFAQVVEDFAAIENLPETDDDPVYFADLGVMTTDWNEAASGALNSAIVADATVGPWYTKLATDFSAMQSILTIPAIAVTITSG